MFTIKAVILGPEQSLSPLTPLMEAHNRSMLAHYTANIGLWSVLFHNFIARGLTLNWDVFHYKLSPVQLKPMLRRSQGNTLTTF